MVKKYSKLILNKDNYLSFEITNESEWTELYLINRDIKTYLGSEVYLKIYDHLFKFLFSDEKGNIVDYKNEKIFCMIVLSDPHCCLYRTINDDTTKILIQDFNLNFIYEIKIDKDFLRFE